MELGAPAQASNAYRLVSVIEAHSEDIKSVHASASFSEDYSDQVFSVSRDATCKSWGKRPARDAQDQSADWTAVETFKGSDRYLNAVTALEPCDEMLSGQIIFGGLDHIIYCYAPSRRPDPSEPTTKPAEMLLEHWDNVTSLSIWRSPTADERGAHRTLLISSSWDYSARVHELDVDTGRWKLLHFLRGAESAVWGACVLDGRKGGERYLTSSADLFIRLYEGEKLTVIYPGHEDVPRSICALPAIAEPSSAHARPFKPNEVLFLTCSNDASLRIWSLDPERRDPANQTRGPDALRVLVPPKGQDGHEASIVYEARPLRASRVASVGEGGVLRVWNYDEGQLLQTIKCTATSLWSLCLTPNAKDIVTAGSDGRLRIYSSHADAVEVQDAKPMTQQEMAIDGEAARRENDEDLTTEQGGDGQADTGARVADEMLAQALDSVPQGSKELASSSIRLLHALLDRTLIAALDLIDRDMVYRILPRRLSWRRRRTQSRAKAQEEPNDKGYWHVLSSDAPAEADMSSIARLNSLDLGGGLGQGQLRSRPRSYAVFPAPLRGGSEGSKAGRGRSSLSPAFCECPAFAIRCWGLDVEAPGAPLSHRNDVGILESTRTPSKGGGPAHDGRGHVVVVCKHLLAVELARRLKRYQTWSPDQDEALLDALTLS